MAKTISGPVPRRIRPIKTLQAVIDEHFGGLALNLDNQPGQTEMHLAASAARHQPASCCRLACLRAGVDAGRV
jgi:hypothetical protein